MKILDFLLNYIATLLIVITMQFSSNLTKAIAKLEKLVDKISYAPLLINAFFYMIFSKEMYFEIRRKIKNMKIKDVKISQIAKNLVKYMIYMFPSICIFSFICVTSSFVIGNEAFTVVNYLIGYSLFTVLVYAIAVLSFVSEFVMSGELFDGKPFVKKQHDSNKTDNISTGFAHDYDFTKIFNNNNCE